MTTQTSAEQSSAKDQWTKGRKWTFSPRVWVFAGGAAALAGLLLNWNWLTAAGLAPIILGILPCAAMCALGLCAHRFTGGADPASCRGSKDQAERKDER